MGARISTDLGVVLQIEDEAETEIDIPKEDVAMMLGKNTNVPATAPREDFSAVSASRDHRGKIFPRCSDRIQGPPEGYSNCPRAAGPYGTIQNLHNNHSTNT